MHFVKPPLDKAFHNVYFTGAKLKAKSTEDRSATLQFAWKVTAGIAQSLPEIVRHVWPALMGKEPALGVDLDTKVKSQNLTFRSTPGSPLSLLELKGYDVRLGRLDLGDGRDMAILRFEIETGITQQIADLIVALLGAQISMQALEGQQELAQPPAEAGPKSAIEHITEQLPEINRQLNEKFGPGHTVTVGFAEQAEKAERERGR